MDAVTRAAPALGPVSRFIPKCLSTPSPPHELRSPAAEGRPVRHGRRGDDGAQGCTFKGRHHGVGLAGYRSPPILPRFKFDFGLSLSARTLYALLQSRFDTDLHTCACLSLRSVSRCCTAAAAAGPPKLPLLWRGGRAPRRAPVPHILREQSVGHGRGEKRCEPGVRRSVQACSTGPRVY
jgi:hypothetical protein